MKVAAIRDKLSDYIQIADDEKIKAMYVLFKHEIDTDLEWWQNSDFIKELDTDYKNWKSGKARGYTIEEVDKTIDQMRLKREGK